MRTTLIPLLYLEGIAPQENIIPAVELSRYIAASELLEEARRDANAMRDDAEQLIIQAQQESPTLYQQTRITQQQEGMQRVDAARDENIINTIHWLIEEIERESAMTHHLEERIRLLAAHALSEFAGKQEHAELLVRRIARTIPEIVNEGQLRLYVAPIHRAAVHTALCGDKRVTVYADPTITTEHARLENDLVSIVMSLATHLSILIERLKQTVQPLRREPRHKDLSGTIVAAMPAPRSQPYTIVLNDNPLTYCHTPQREGTHG